MGFIQLPWDRVGTGSDAPSPTATHVPKPEAPPPANPAIGLIQAQDEARKQYPPNPATRETYCNDATYCIARRMKAPLRPLGDVQGKPYLANRMAQNLAESTEYRDVSPDEAQKLANQGQFVVGAWHNPTGHGHVDTVRPEGVPGDVPVGHSGPLLNDIGAEDHVARQSKAFKAADPVHYYTPWKGKGGKH